MRTRYHSCCPVGIQTFEVPDLGLFNAVVYEVEASQRLQEQRRGGIGQNQFRPDTLQLADMEVT